MMKVAKLVNKEYWTFPKVTQFLRGCLLVVCLLPLLVVNGSQIQEKTSTWIPADILTYFSLSGNGYCLNKKPLSYQHDKWPSFLFSLGRYHLDVLHYTMIESKNAFQNPSLQLYSFGGGVRKLFPRGMVGIYLLIDSTLKNSSSLSNILNLCNLNIGFEATFPTQNQITANIYIPLRTHQENFSIALHSDTETIKNYAITSPYYLESGNWGFDIHLGQTSVLGKHSIKVILGAYTFFDREKTLTDEVLSLKTSSRWVVGCAHKLTWQWNNYFSCYYKIAYDTTQRPLNLSLGIQWKHSIHNPIHFAHQRLWLPPIERHLAPLLLPERITKIEAASKLNYLYLEEYKKAYKKHPKIEEAKERDSIFSQYNTPAGRAYRDAQTDIKYKEYCKCLEEVSRIIFAEKQQYFYEILLFSQKTKSSIIRQISLVIAPDKRPGDLHATARYNTFIQEVFPILWGTHHRMHDVSRKEKVIRYTLAFK